MAKLLVIERLDNGVTCVVCHHMTTAVGGFDGDRADGAKIDEFVQKCGK